MSQFRKMIKKIPLKITISTDTIRVIRKIIKKIRRKK